MQKKAISQKPFLAVAAILPMTQVLGPGNRAVVWLQGCLQNCPHCIAPEWRELDSRRAHEISPIELAHRLLANRSVDGLTISGGEPMLQAEALYLFIRQAKRINPEINVICYSGYSFEYLCQFPPSSGVSRLMTELDVLIDGPYIHTLDNGVGLRGSSNQRVIHLTNRLLHANLEDAPRQVEFVIQDGAVLMAGIPPRDVLEVFAGIESEVVYERA